MTEINTKIIDISREPGVADLPLSVRGQFALAIRAERLSDPEGAEKYLAKAIAAEDKLVMG